MASSKEFKTLIQDAREQGWVVELTRGGHYKWLSPLGGFFFSSQTPSDNRALSNLERDLRVNGFIKLVPKKRKRNN